jgi:1,4-dihydroxy-2-naphthoyl-CoA hydrolase
VVTIEALNERGVGKLPGFLGIVFTRVDAAEIEAELPLRAELMAANGFLHAGSIVTLADTSCGYGCFANLPQGATGFTTIELKSNHLGTAREGTIASFAKAVHMGRNTQVWDAVVTHKESNRTIALFRCTQMILYPK